MEGRLAGGQDVPEIIQKPLQAIGENMKGPTFIVVSTHVGHVLIFESETELTKLIDHLTALRDKKAGKDYPAMEAVVAPDMKGEQAWKYLDSLTNKIGRGLGWDGDRETHQKSPYLKKED